MMCVPACADAVLPPPSVGAAPFVPAPLSPLPVPIPWKERTYSELRCMPQCVCVCACVCACVRVCVWDHVCLRCPLNSVRQWCAVGVGD